MNLYPLKFKPIFKDKIWGGDKIKRILGLDYAPLLNCGEAWVLSGIDANQSVVTNGFLAENELNELVEIYMGDLVGDKVFERYGNVFPLLIKFIDSREWLSVQVHPDDALAKKRLHPSGKTEMWYVVQADENAELINGFNSEMDEQKYLSALKNNTLKNTLRFEKVNTSDAFFIPSGCVHALGPGNLLIEIQQASDITYRIYDWDRTDKQNHTRELHNTQALDAINYVYEKNSKIRYIPINNTSSKIVECKHFSTSIISLTKKIVKDYFNIDSFVIYICFEGNVEVNYHERKETLNKGEVMLIPAEIKELMLTPQTTAKLLEVFIK